MRLDDLRDELRAIAAETPPRPHDLSAVVRPAIRRLRVRRIVAGVVAIAVISSGAIAIGRARRTNERVSTIAGSGPSGTTPALSAATIANGRWSAIAAFPLESRSHDSVIWTGSQMIVWGGDDGQRVFADGAAYDPGTNTWRVLPRAPIAARTFATVVWAGAEMIVWGGDRAYVGNYANDGAVFDPVTWKWRLIATSPLSARYGADAVWTGSEVIVFGGLDSNTQTTSRLDGAAYDPATDRWTHISEMPGVGGATIEDLRFTWTGRELWVWEFWSRTTGTLKVFREQLVAYDPSKDSWRLGPAADDPHRNVYAPIWTGSEIIAAAEPPLCDLPDGAQNCGPPPTHLNASELDPASGKWRSIPHGPADDGEIATVWTGADLVVISGVVNDRATGNTIVAAGTAAAWNPETNVWTTLPRAPVVPGNASAFWTGSEILVWGSDGGLRFGLESTAAIPDPTPATDTFQVPLDEPGAPLAVSKDRVWVGTTTGVDVYDPVTMRRVGQVPTTQPVVAVASRADGAWLVTGRDEELQPPKQNPPYRLELVEPSTLRVQFSTQLPFATGYRASEHLRIVAVPGTAWVSGESTVVRVDTPADTVTRVSLSGRGAGNIAADDSGLWITSNFAYADHVKIVPLLHIDAGTNAVSVIPGLPDGFYWSVAATAHAAWITAALGTNGMSLIRVDAATHAVTTRPLAGIALVTGDGQLWVQVIDPTGRSLNFHNLIGEIDTATGTIMRTIKISIGEEPGSSGDGYANPPFVVADGRIWSTYSELQRTTV